MEMELGLKGKKVIVTGASRGIGLSIAETFSKEGADVSICARGAENLETARARIATHGTKVHAQTCDVSDADALVGYVEAAAAALGGLNILVNNPSGFGRTDDEEGWRLGLDVDLMALVRGSWAAVPHIEKAGGGAIVHTSSISGLTSSLRTPPYGAVKAAVIQYTKTQALQLAPKNIRVNCLAPGSIEFPGGTWDDAKQNNPKLYAGIQASIPFGRLGEPEEVANLAVFLASDAASWVTGVTIAVDGGQML
jgi:3-oxoacyl-[acyl-carrier protein] reductase